MRPEIDDGAAALALVPAPVAELVHVLEAVLLQPRLRDDVAIRCAEVGRHAAVPLPVDRDDAAEHLRFLQDLVVAVQVARVRAALVADLKELARLALGGHHAARALERVRHLLLAVHVLAGLEAVDRVLRVPEVRRRDDHRVELFLLVEHLAVILVGVRLVLEPLEAVDDALLVVFGPDVADGAEAQPGDAEHRVGEHLPLRAGAEEGDVDHLQIRGRLGRGGDLLDSCLLERALRLPRVGEEAQRRDRRQPLQHVAAIQFSWFARRGLRLRLSRGRRRHGSSPSCAQRQAALVARNGRRRGCLSGMLVNGIGVYQPK